MAYGIPKKDGSGQGIRLNRGRGGCEDTKEIGEGQKITKLNENKYNWNDEEYQGEF